MEIEAFRGEFAPEVALLCETEGWRSWSDPARVEQALSAPGVIALVAVENGRVVGVAQVLSDRQVNWMLSMLVVAADRRRQGIGTRLIDAAFERAGARRLDLLAENGASAFYRSRAGREMAGFRLYPPNRS